MAFNTPRHKQSDGSKRAKAGGETGAVCGVSKQFHNSSIRRPTLIRHPQIEMQPNHVPFHLLAMTHVTELAHRGLSQNMPPHDRSGKSAELADARFKRDCVKQYEKAIPSQMGDLGAFVVEMHEIDLGERVFAHGSGYDRSLCRSISPRHRLKKFEASFSVVTHVPTICSVRAQRSLKIINDSPE
jgi:hypothetical protein